MTGRGQAGDALARWLDALPSAVRLRAATAAEALAYFAAFVSSLPLDRQVALHLAVRNRHHVLLPVGPETLEDDQDIRLPAIPRNEFENALREMGLDGDRVRDVARESRGQLAILTRLLGRGPTATVPAWASPAEGGQVAPLLLAGCWDRDRPADRDAVQRLAGRPYAEVEALAVRWHSTSDSPCG